MTGVADSEGWGLPGVRELEDGQDAAVRVPHPGHLQSVRHRDAVVVEIERYVGFRQERNTAGPQVPHLFLTSVTRKLATGQLAEPASATSGNR